MKAPGKYTAFAALLLTLHGCSPGDIEARNPVGEKIVIKKSTVSQKKWGSADAEKILATKEATNFRQWAVLNYRNCVNGLPEKECRKRWLGEDHERQVADTEDLKDFIARGLEINYVEFTPILIDLNNPDQMYQTQS